MMLKICKYCFCLSILLNVKAFAQVPQVPDRMSFAGMELKINAAAQKQIQAYVNDYRRNAKYFQSKVDLANLYFPIIEQKFKEKNVPTDFKYLIIQESGFVSDAVSSSNAVGYWQFKKETAWEVGLVVNEDVDERKNISKSSLAAAEYLRKNNINFGNWIYALQSYNQGAGGTKKDSNPSYYGKNTMDITEKTHWYVHKFLAHLIAYSDAVGGESALGIYLKEYPAKSVSLSQIAKSQNLDENQLADYNKWLSANKIPDDREYIVLLPIKGKGISTTIPDDKKQEGIPEIFTDVNIDLEKKEIRVKTAEGLPDIKFKMGKKSNDQAAYLKENPHVFGRINGLNVIKANAGDTKDVLALAGGISTENFLKYNDVKSYDLIKAGQFYYIESKRNKGQADYHIVKWNENLWGISQHYGIYLKSLEKKNRIEKFETLKAGRVLWLKKTRPKSTPVKHEDPGPKPQTTIVIDKKIDQVEPKTKTENKTQLEEPKKQFPKDTISIEKEVKKDLEDLEKRKDVILHTVQIGETLFGISQFYKVPLDDLMKWNNLQTTDIKVDQLLIVAIKDNPTPERQLELLHEVKQGETLYSISKIYGVSVEHLMTLNGKTTTAVSIGEKLVIKK